MNDWDSTILKILKAIDELELANDREQTIKIAIEYMLIRMTETEEIFNDNLEILNKYASNSGFKKRKVK